MIGVEAMFLKLSATIAVDLIKICIDLLTILMNHK